MLMQCRLLLRVDLNCQASEFYPKPWTVVRKCSTLDIYGSPEYPSAFNKKKTMIQPVEKGGRIPNPTLVPWYIFLYI